MRIACIDNMNNNMFAITRLLRDQGYDAQLLLVGNEMDHFHPSADCFDLGYQAFTRHVRWGHPYELHNYSPEVIRRDLEPYDFLIGCGATPAYVHRAGRQLDIFFPYGTDLIYYPFFKFTDPRRQVARYRFWTAQSQGISHARYIQLDRANGIYETPLRRLCVEGTRLAIGPPVVHLPTYNSASIVRNQQRTHWASDFASVRERCYPLVFHQARHVWKTKSCLASLKANDRLVRGFADFVKEHPSINPGLIMLEYGVDVQHTRRLVDELGITAHVFWFPKMTRKDLLVGLNMADIGTGEFHNSWLSYGAVFESLALAKPFMGRRDDELFLRWYPELYPMIDAKNDEAIRRSLNDFCERPEHYRRMGEAGRKWYQQHVVEAAVSAYTQILSNAVAPARSRAG